MIETAFFSPGFFLESNRHDNPLCYSSKNKPPNLGNHIWYASFQGLQGPGSFLCLNNQNASSTELQTYSV